MEIEGYECREFHEWTTETEDDEELPQKVKYKTIIQEEDLLD